MTACNLCLYLYITMQYITVQYSTVHDWHVNTVSDITPHRSHRGGGGWPTAKSLLSGAGPRSGAGGGGQGGETRQQIRAL